MEIFKYWGKGVREGIEEFRLLSCLLMGRTLEEKRGIKAIMELNAFSLRTHKTELPIGASSEHAPQKPQFKWLWETDWYCLLTSFPCFLLISSFVLFLFSFNTQAWFWKDKEEKLHFPSKQYVSSILMIMLEINRFKGRRVIGAHQVFFQLLLGFFNFK